MNSIINPSLLSEVFVTLFVITDPPGTVPVIWLPRTPVSSRV